jgi:hypothetical protein
MSTCGNLPIGSCVDCNKLVWRKRSRCKSCAQLFRWSQKPDDARREHLSRRNRAVRAGSFPYEDSAWLEDRYVRQRMSLREISREAGCSLRTIARWMRIHGVATRADAKPTPRRGRDNGKWKGGPRHACADCGGPALRVATRCAQCYKSSMVGPSNPNWKGIADIMTLVRGWAYEHWRPAVFSRDSYACKRCGDDRGGNLEAHHVRPLSVIVRAILDEGGFDLGNAEGRARAVAHILTREEITSIDNGMTLCEACHKRQHAA